MGLACVCIATWLTDPRGIESEVHLLLLKAPEALSTLRAPVPASVSQMIHTEPDVTPVCWVSMVYLYVLCLFTTSEVS